MNIYIYIEKIEKSYNNLIFNEYAFLSYKRNDAILIYNKEYE